MPPQRPRSNPDINIDILPSYLRRPDPEHDERSLEEFMKTNYVPAVDWEDFTARSRNLTMQDCWMPNLAKPPSSAKTWPKSCAARQQRLSPRLLPRIFLSCLVINRLHLIQPRYIQLNHIQHFLSNPSYPLTLSPSHLLILSPSQLQTFNLTIFLPHSSFILPSSCLHLLFFLLYSSTNFN